MRRERGYLQREGRVSVKGKAVFAKKIKPGRYLLREGECLLEKGSIFWGCECLLRGGDLLLWKGACLLKENELP